MPAPSGWTRAGFQVHIRRLTSHSVCLQAHACVANANGFRHMFEYDSVDPSAACQQLAGQGVSATQPPTAAEPLAYDFTIRND